MEKEYTFRGSGQSPTDIKRQVSSGQDLEGGAVTFRHISERTDF